MSVYRISSNKSSVNNFPTVRPTLDLDFANSKTLDPRITFTRSSGGSYVGADGLIKYAGVNEARFDHNPTTGESLGLLVEEQRTNSIRNNTMVGAVAGTPGTVPTNWSGATTADGLTREIIGIGTQNGISYIDVRFSGTSGTGGSTVLVTFDSLTQAAASTGQTWTPSIYLSIANGSATNISTLTIRHRYYNAIGTPLTASDTIILTSVSSVLQRFNGTAFTATDALTAYTMFLLNVDFVNSSPVDITLRIGLPQLEQGAFATSVIPTTTSTRTRAADNASITGKNFSDFYRQDEGTLFCRYNRIGIQAASTTIPTPWGVSDGTSVNNMSLVGGFSVPGNRRFDIIISGSATAQLVLSNTETAQTFNKSCVAYKLNDIAGSYNAQTVLPVTSSNIPSVNQLCIGRRDPTSLVDYLNGTISRITYYPKRLPNAQLQALTK